MPKTVLDEAIPFSVESAPHEGQRNPFAEQGSIRDLAAIAVEHAIVLVELGRHIPVDLIRRGYARRTLQRLRARILMLSLPHQVARDAVNLLDQLSQDYSNALTDPAYLKGEPDRGKRVNELISAAFAEAIVYKLLEKAGRLSDTLLDVHFYLSSTDRRTARNVDFLWALPARKIAEMYECKTTPKNFLFEWTMREVPGHEATGLRDKLNILLVVVNILTGAGWRVHLGCVTIRTREAVLPFIDSKPDELHIYCQEDLLGQFPPPICYT